MNQTTLINLAGLIPFSAFMLLIVLQYISPKRDLRNSGVDRVLHNLFLFVVNSIVLRLLIPVTLVMASVWASKANIGLFNLVSINLPVTLLCCVVLLDFAIYWQHVATHRFPLLWRLHKVHHADHDMDVTTAIRFHPIELVLSLAYKSLAVILLGAPTVAVIVFELLLFVGPAFNHSNLALPRAWDKWLRLVLVTPDMHRAHHSVLIAEQNTNYGFFLPWWDRVFNTYTEKPTQGHENMEIGLANKAEACERVDQMLLAPFK